MEKKNRDDVASRFAENLVAQMLQRSGRAFYQAHGGSDDACDFIVQNGDRIMVLEVKYADQSAQAESIWKDWQNGFHGKRDAAGSAMTLSLARNASQPPRGEQQGPAHLVVVTGRGDAVFTDPDMAPLLATDERTTLSIFAP